MANQTDDQKAKALEAKRLQEAAEAQAQADTEAAEAKARKDAERAARRPDETDPGGRYVVNGVTVDANGELLKDEA